MDYISKVKKESIRFGGIPFWSWNDKLQPDELRRQINNMHELGMNGYFMHARGGLETEYMSDEWFDCIKACIDEGKKLGMESWAYDENGWPSGFGGGMVLKEPYNYAEFLTLSETDVFPDISVKAPPEEYVLAVYVKENGAVRRVAEPSDSDPKPYYCVIHHNDTSYVDVLDEKVIRDFIRVTHEEYKKRLGEDFGKAMPGFFTDEPQYYRYNTPYSKIIPAEFEKRCGYSVFDGLAALFIDYEGAEEFRYDYYYLCHELFINAFAKQIYDWCDANGCKLTGHAVEETALFMQMWCCGGVMPFYEFEHMPGIDYLGRGINTDLCSKQLGSVAAQLGKEKVLTETFACCGWDVSPKELKRIADLQYVSGVNVMCQHLYAYSIRGQRKRDYPANYSEHLPWQDAFGDFVKYYNRLGMTLSMGTENVNCLIIHPIHSAYLNYKRKEDRATVAELEDALNGMLSYFGDRQISYHFGDEVLMRRHGSVEGNTLKIGKMTYDFVVLPKIYTLDGTTVSLLKEYLKGGGKLALFDGKPDRIDGRKADMSWLIANATVDDIEASANCRIRGIKGEILPMTKSMTRDTEYGKLFYVTNVGETDYPCCDISFKGASELYEIGLEQDVWESGKVVKKIDASSASGGLKHRTSLESGRSRLFIEKPLSEPYCDKRPGDSAENAEALSLGGQYSVTGRAENALTLDFAQISKTGGAFFEEKKPVIRIFDELLRERFSGLLTMKYPFTVAKVPPKVIAAMEPLRYRSVNVNGEPVEFCEGWRLDRSFRIADITSLLKVGENDITVSFDYYQSPYVYEVLYGNVMESLRNCLNFDTEVESMYLFGDFSVKTDAEFRPDARNSLVYEGGFALDEPENTVDPSDLVTRGFPFFAGRITLEKEFEYKKGQGKTLVISGRYSYADVTLNGEHVKRLMFTDRVSLDGLLREGTNTLSVTLCNSNRNLLGPHHWIDPEPYSVGPGVFSLENMWHDGKCELYRDRYAFVRYGADISLR